MSYPRPYPRKRILIFINRVNFGSDSLVEVLRMAVGLSGGLAQHQVAIVFMGDGMTECLRSRLTEAAQPYMLAALSGQVTFWADKYSLDLRGMNPEMLLPQCQILAPEELSQFMGRADIHVRL